MPPSCLPNREGLSGPDHTQRGLEPQSRFYWLMLYAHCSHESSVSAAAAVVLPCSNGSLHPTEDLHLYYLL